MRTLWKPLSVAEAIEHPLYGVKGWLLVFAIGVLLGLLRELGSLNLQAHEAGMVLSELLAIDHPAIIFSKIALAVNAAVVLLIYWFLFTKHRKFRIVASWLLVGTFPVVALGGMLNPFPGLGGVIVQAFIPWLISCVIWVTYFNRSRRVRCTFEHLVRVDDSLYPLAAAVESNSDSLTRVTSSGEKNIVGQSATSVEPPNRDVSTRSNVSITAEEEVLWAQALAEFESPSRRSGLWAKSFSDSGGDELHAKASYLALRVLELRKQRQDAHAAQEEAELQERENEKLAKLSDMERADYLLPKGQCPNCAVVIPLAALGCPNCQANFGPTAAWKPLPLAS